ncbi:MAG: ATP-binding protein, partial [Candidatus Brocadiales bacterium]
INNIELIKDYIGDITSVEGERLDKEKLFHTLEEIQKCLDDTRAGTEQIRRIISAVYEFSHPGHDRLDYIDINTTIEVALNVVWHEIKQKARVIKDYGELPKILCYPQYLVQVFTNLFLNAVHAIPESGEIRVKTYRQGERVCVEISDTGVGISEEDLKRIFDPFFTTKEVGKGTGLGLSIVYNLVTKAEGNIEVTSGVGEGTTFKITLPLRTKSDTSSSGHG